MAAERDIGGTQLQEDNSAAEGSGSQSQADGILSQMAIFMASLRRYCPKEIVKSPAVGV